jgi:hypothetical protein
MKPLKNKPADNIMEELRLISGGRLLSTKWDGDSKRYVTTDVTPSAPCYLFEACELDAGVILRDIFLLLQQHIDFYQNAIGNHVTEFVAEGLQQQQTKPEDSGLSYLELSWKLEYSPKEKRLWGNLRPRFCGFAPDGEKCGLSGSYANELALLPVRLNHQFPIVVQQKKTPELQDFNGAEFSLGQILEGIIWELSYFGGPQGRKEFESLIAETISEIKTREENTASKKRC